MGDSPKWVKSRRRRKREKEREKERAKVCDNNGQATHGARKHAWRTQAAWANKCVVQSLHDLQEKLFQCSEKKMNDDITNKYSTSKY